MTDLLALHRDRLPPMMKLLGVDLLSVDTTRVVGQMLVRPEMGNG